MKPYAKNDPRNGKLNLKIHFSENIFLPQKPGQLHFIFCLKLDFFGVSIRKMNETHINCFYEG